MKDFEMNRRVEMDFEGRFGMSRRFEVEWGIGNCDFEVVRMFEGSN
jgi:hypothetical protein